MNTTPFPNKKYQIIYADPPWAYQQQLSGGSKASNHYPTMPVDEIKALPVADLTDTNCLLFLWIGSPILDDGLAVGNAWGFKFTTVGFVWNKKKSVVGHYTLSQCELCLIFKKGSIPKPRGSRKERQLITAKAGKHSVKPLEAKSRIDRMFPEQSKIELFARPGLLKNAFPKWDHWGNEV